MTGTLRREDYEPLLFAARQAGFNILRVWGGGIYENDCFYELCDRLGILVWQDFMFACSAVPAALDDIQNNFLAEAKEQIVRLRNHPSLALWCGGNEYMPDCCGKPYSEGNFLIRVVLRGLCGELDGGRVYIHNSPYGLEADEWSTLTGDAHTSVMDTVLSNGDIADYRKYHSGKARAVFE